MAQSNPILYHTEGLVGTGVGTTVHAYVLLSFLHISTTATLGTVGH